VLILLIGEWSEAKSLRISRSDEMALVLGVSVGDVIDIDDHWIKFHSFDGLSNAIVVDEAGEPHLISTEYEAEVVKSVWVSLAPLPGKRLRLRFEAPRSVSIVRRAINEQ
jgi:hypothetical protein